MNALDNLPVVVTGADPVGLAAAAHLAERGLPFTVLEAGDSAGAAVRQRGHVRLFSRGGTTSTLSARRLLDDAGWVAPDLERLPTGAEFAVDYLQPLVPRTAWTNSPTRRPATTPSG
ncbi:NAD(P)-binding protein [Micromonospora sp. NPDC051925]|uniref:NAD(P)-binding protein n=1 Tax=Micromonospora sp. NPDC051925 TaxID=3364288 RepID=UPI0037C6F68A